MHVRSRLLHYVAVVVDLCGLDIYKLRSRIFHGFSFTSCTHLEGRDRWKNVTLLMIDVIIYYVDTSHNTFSQNLNFSRFSLFSGYISGRSV